MTINTAVDAFDKSIAPENYDLLCRTVKELSGLYLDSNKYYLVETRLQAVAKEFGFNSINRLIEGLRGPMALKLRTEIAEAMATPETFFFRDKKPFDQFKDIMIPEIIKRNAATKKISIWSAACSSGQEPYSIAMIMDELSRSSLMGWQIRILATDFSTKILKKCQEGLYSQFEVQRGLPIQYLMKHFVQQGQQWIIKDELKKKIEFRTHNLLHNPAVLGNFDVIFCRNVLFYFEPPDKSHILEDLARVTTDGGFLFLGSAESVTGLCDKFGTMGDHRGFYVRTTPGGSLAAAG